MQFIYFDLKKIDCEEDSHRYDFKPSNRAYGEYYIIVDTEHALLYCELEKMWYLLHHNANINLWTERKYAPFRFFDFKTIKFISEEKLIEFKIHINDLKTSETPAEHRFLWG